MKKEGGKLYWIIQHNTDPDNYESAIELNGRMYKEETKNALLRLTLLRLTKAKWWGNKNNCGRISEILRYHTYREKGIRSISKYF